MFEINYIFNQFFILVLFMRLSIKKNILYVVVSLCKWGKKKNFYSPILIISPENVLLLHFPVTGLRIFILVYYLLWFSIKKILTEIILINIIVIKR